MSHRSAPMERPRKTELIFELTLPFIEKPRTLKRLTLVSRHVSYWASHQLFRKLRWLHVYNPKDDAVAALLQEPNGWRYASSVRSIVICIDVAEAPLPGYPSHEDLAATLLHRLPGLRQFTLCLKPPVPDEHRPTPVKAFNFNPLARAMGDLSQLKSFIFTDCDFTGGHPPVEVNSDLGDMLKFGSRLEVLDVEQSSHTKFIDNLLLSATPVLQNLSLPRPDEHDIDPSALRTITSLHFPKLISLKIQDFEEFDFAAFTARHPHIKYLDYLIDYGSQEAFNLSECHSLERLAITDALRVAEVGGMITQLPRPELLLSLEISLEEPDIEHPFYDFCSNFCNLEDLTIGGWYLSRTIDEWEHNEMDHRFDAFTESISSYLGEGVEFIKPYPNLAKVLPSLKRLNLYQAPVRFPQIPLPPFRWDDESDFALESILGPDRWEMYPNDGGKKKLQNLHDKIMWQWCAAAREPLESGVRAFASQASRFERLHWQPYDRDDLDIDVIVKRTEDGEIVIEGGFGRSHWSTGEGYNGPWEIPLLEKDDDDDIDHNPDVFEWEDYINF